MLDPRDAPSPPLVPPFINGTDLCQSVEDYSRDQLVNTLVAAMGSAWQSRAEATTAAARYLGFRRTGSKIAAAFKSAINAAIRRKLVECDGAKMIRKT